MKSAIDSAGRIVIPSDIRKAAGLQSGTVVEIVLREGIVSIEPAPATVRLVKRGKLKVAVMDDESPTLTQDDVRTVRDQIRKG